MMSDWVMTGLSSVFMAGLTGREQQFNLFPSQMGCLDGHGNGQNYSVQFKFKLMLIIFKAEKSSNLCILSKYNTVSNVKQKRTSSIYLPFLDDNICLCAWVIKSIHSTQVWSKEKKSVGNALPCEMEATSKERLGLVHRSSSHWYNTTEII